MTIYVISDLHFNHDKDFIYESRGFNSIQEHDIALVNRMNSIVQEDDELYILGDICMGMADKSIDRFKLINCRNIHIILGNHDSNSKIELLSSLENVVEVCAAKYLKDKKWTFYLSHFPTMTCNHDDDEKSLRDHLWNLSGHTHNKNIFENFKYGVVNCSVDSLGYPYSIDAIKKLIVARCEAERKPF